MECLNTPEGEKFQQKIEEVCTDNGSDIIVFYIHVFFFLFFFFSEFDSKLVQLLFISDLKLLFLHNTTLSFSWDIDSYYSHSNLDTLNIYV